MRVIVTIAVFFLLASRVLVANEDGDTSKVLTEIDLKLYSFCESAILSDRGVSRLPFSISTDQWIATKSIIRQ